VATFLEFIDLKGNFYSNIILLISYKLRSLTNRMNPHPVLEDRKRELLIGMDLVSYQLDLVTPGRFPTCAILRSTCLETPKSR
jgi:hypothetical protein